MVCPRCLGQAGANSKNVTNGTVAMSQDLKDAALEYHAKPRPGKLSVEITKPTRTSRDLSLAYSPGVAEPVREIAKDPENAYKYTAKGNLEIGRASCREREFPVV